jgi:hypothetical protein
MSETATKKNPLGKDGDVPNLLVGQRVRITGGEFEGRMAYVLDRQFAGTEAILQATAPNHPYRAFAEVEAYICRSRDGRNETFSVAPDDLEPLAENNGWGRGSI